MLPTLPAADGAGKSPAGAYGLELIGLAAAARWMQIVPVGARRLSVTCTTAVAASAARSSVGRNQADVALIGGGRLRMVHGVDEVRFSFPQAPPAEDLLHPFLAPAAALAQVWAGAEAIHGGAYIGRAGAVLLLAAKAGGKSTTLAHLALREGVTVLSDDLAVIEAGAVHPGPRCIDLREPVDLRPPVEVDPPGTQAVVRGATRRRVRLAAAPARRFELSGVVVLEWGSRVTVRSPPGEERLLHLSRQRMFARQLPPDPRTLLHLAALPWATVTRPRGQAGLRDAVAALLDWP